MLWKHLMPQKYLVILIFLLNFLLNYAKIKNFFILQDVKKDEMSRKAYKFLAALHEVTLQCFCYITNFVCNSFTKNLFFEYF